MSVIMCENREMEPIKWETILIDWVNCLKLNKPIQDITELRDGVFLRHLRKLIKKSTDPIPDDDLTIIFDLLARHYPKIKFPERDSIHIADLPHQNLVNLASLLMHYTCIYDRKNVLTAPLCYNLSPAVQLQIRSFLEKVNGETTTDELAEIINNTFAGKRPRCQLIQVVNTPLAKKSPLQDLLKTPAAKHLKWQEKEREIERLKRELELAKYEKTDFEAELREQNAKILIQLQQKCSEVKRLRAEVESLEMRTPPHFQDVDSRETQKLLRLEIQNLEQYVQRCEEEHEELRKERDEVKEKTRVLETERTMWQEKFFDIEEKFQFFAERARDTEAINETLKAHCTELQAMLDEYRNKSPNDLDDSSMQLCDRTNRWSKDFNPLEPEEDLAHSVVDVQLKEVEKKLEDALDELGKALEEKQLLEDVRDVNDGLKKELSKETSHRLQLEQEHEVVLRKLDETVVQLKEAKAEKANLQVAFEALESSSNQKIACLMEACEKLESNLKVTKAMQQETLEVLESVKLEKQGLAIKLVGLVKELADTKNLLRDTKNMLDSAEEEEHVISEQLEETKQKLAECEENLEVASKNLEDVTSESFAKLRQANAEKADLQKSFEAMKSLSDQKIACLMEASEKLQLRIKDTDMKQQETLEALEKIKLEKEGLTVKFECLVKESENTKSLLSNTRNMLDNAELEKQAISKRLEDTEQRLAESEESLKVSTKNFEEISTESFAKLTQINAEKAEIQKSFEALESSSNQKIACLMEACEKLESNLKVTTAMQQETLEVLESVKLEKEGLAIKLVGLVKELADTKNLLRDTKNMLDSAEEEEHVISKQLEETKQKLAECEENLKVTTKNLEAVTSESFAKLRQANAENADLHKSFEAMKSLSDQKIACLMEASEKLQLRIKDTDMKQQETLEALENIKLEKESLTVKFECLVKESENTKSVLSNTRNMFDNAELEKQAISKRLEDTEQRLAESEESLKVSTKNFEEISTESFAKLTRINAEKAEIQKSFEALESSSNQKIACLMEACEKLESNLKVTKAMQQETLEVLESVKLEKEGLAIKLVGLVKELADTKNLLRDTKNMLDSAEEEEHVISKQLEETKQKLAECEENLKVTTKNLEAVTSESFAKLRQANAENADLHKSFEAMKSLSDQKIACLMEASEKLQLRIKDTDMKQQETLEALENIKLEKESLTVKFECLVKESENTKSVLSNTRNMFDNAELEKQAISKRLEDTEQRLAESEESLKVSTKNFEEISTETLAKLTQINAEKAEIQKSFEALESSSNQKITSLIDGSEKLQSSLKDTETKWLETLEALESVKLENESLVVRLEYLTNDLDYTKELLDNTKNMLKGAKEEKQTILQQLEEMETKLMESEGNLKLSVEDLEAVKSESFIKLKQADAEKADLQKAFEALQSSSNQEKSSIIQTLSTYEKRHAELTEELKSIKEEKTVVSKFLDLNSSELRKVTQEKEQILEALEMSNADNKELNLKLASMQGHYQKLVADREALLESFQKTVEDQTCQAQAREHALSCEKIALEETLLTTSKALEDASIQVEVTKGNLKTAKEDLEKACNDKMLIQDKLKYTVQHLEVTMEKLEQTEQLLQSSIADKESIISDSVETAKLMEETQQKLTDTKRQFEEISGERIQLANQVTELTRNLQKLEQEKSTLIQTLSSYEDRHAELIEELKNIREEKSEMAKCLDLNNSVLAEATREKNRIREALRNEDNQELNLKLASLQSAYEKLVTDKAEILENLQKTIKDKEELFSELNNVSAQKKENDDQVEKLEFENDRLNELLVTIQKDKADIAKEKAEIHDFLQRSVADNEQIMRERDRLQCENAVLAKERDTIYEKLQSAAVEKQNILLSLELSQKETEKVKKERNEILQSQTEIIKETGTNILRAHEVAVEEKKELLKKIETAKNERNKLREAYAAVVATSASQERDIVNLRKKLEQRNNQLHQLGNIKEAYEKLLEENNRHVEEIGALKQKRARDREEYLKYIKKEREEEEARKIKKVKEVQAEYEQKLEKMRTKMLKLYSEEVSKEMQKVKFEHEEVVNMQKTIEDLKDELREIRMERDMLKARDSCLPRESWLERNVAKHGISNSKGRGNKVADRDSSAGSSNTLPVRPNCTRQRPMERVKSTSNLYERESVGRAAQSRRLTPLLQSGDVLEETVTVSRTTSINRIGRNLEMEDEDEDMFSDKCLADLKEGRCVPFGGRESNASRMSELVWRNSMVPPHLKSSYPAELQFVTPSRFGEDDIKTGNIELDDDSMCRLLPGEKLRHKKDFGTTTYKKPGPPTPSKNGGRASLQRNEIQPLREVNSAVSSTPKKITPSRIKALFRGFRDGATAQDNTENVSPQTNKRLSIFKGRK